MANPFQDIGSQIVGKILGSILWIGIAFIIFITVFGLIWFFVIYRRKFDIKVKIVSERAGDKDAVIWDKAAILTDRKDKTKYFRLWGLKFDLPVPKFNVLQSTSEGDYLEILRKSEEDFYFLTPSLVDKTKIIRADGRLYAMADQIQKQIDPDVAYWMTKRKQFNKKMFNVDSLLGKLIEFAPIIIISFIQLFVLYILLDKLPAVLSELSRLTSELKTLKGGDIITYDIVLLSFCRGIKEAVKWKI